MNKLVQALAIFGCLSLTAQTDIINEDFQSGIPAEWTLVINDNNTPNAAVAEYTEAWISKADPEDATNMVASSTSYFEPIDRADRWLISPEIVLGAYGNLITWRAKSHDPSYPEDYKLMISTTDNAITSFTDTLITVTDESPEWKEYELNLTDLGYDNQTIYIAVVLTTFDGFKVYVDDFAVRKEDPVGISEDILNTTLTVYPNPATNQISLKGIELAGVVKVYDLRGREVLSSSTTENIDVSFLNSGIYSVKFVENNGKVFTQKLVIK